MYPKTVYLYQIMTVYYLYEGDEQLSPKTGVNSRELGLESSASDKIGAGKQKKLTFVFEVKKDKKYKNWASAKII